MSEHDNNQHDAPRDGTQPAPAAPARLRPAPMVDYNGVPINDDTDTPTASESGQYVRRAPPRRRRGTVSASRPAAAATYVPPARQLPAPPPTAQYPAEPPTAQYPAAFSPPVSPDRARANRERLFGDPAYTYDDPGGIVLPPPSLGWLFSIPGSIAVGVLSLVVILLFAQAAGLEVSRWVPFMPLQQQVATPPQTIAGNPNPPGDYRLRAAPSVTADQINGILADYGSPAAGTGDVWYRLGAEYGIDPAFAVAFFVVESTAGTAPGWAGWKDKAAGISTHNVGNIICAGYPTCHGRFRDYPDWETGIRDWYRLIDVEYLQGRGHETVADVLPVYAPTFENDTGGYINTVHNLVDAWRRESPIRPAPMGSGFPIGDDLRPAGNPLNASNTVMTQGYGVGTHAPANVWGAIDLALDGDGDGRADPGASQDAPIYATHSGVVTVTPGSYPAGNHVWVSNDQYKTGYAHLSGFAVASGQQVQRGDVIGYMGSTGMSSGPHLDYQVWAMEREQWVNQNPMQFTTLP